MINQATPMPNKNSGFAVIIVAVVAVVVIAAAAGGYLMLKNKTGETNPFKAAKNAASGLTLNPNCEFDDPDLCKFLNNMASLKSYTVTADGAVFTLDNGKTYMKLTSAENTNETIHVAEATYTKDQSDSKWWKDPIETADTSNGETTDAEDYDYDIPTKAEATFTKQEKEACGDLMCFKYSSSDGSVIWFDDTQYKLRKVTYGEGEVVEYSYNNSTVTIPTDTKDVPAGATIMPNGQLFEAPNLEGMSQEELDQLIKQYGGTTN